MYTPVQANMIYDRNGSSAVLRFGSAVMLSDTSSVRRQLVRRKSTSTAVRVDVRGDVRGRAVRGHAFRHGRQLVSIGRAALHRTVRSRRGVPTTRASRARCDGWIRAVPRLRARPRRQQCRHRRRNRGQRRGHGLTDDPRDGTAEERQGEGEGMEERKEQHGESSRCSLVEAQ